MPQNTEPRTPIAVAMDVFAEHGHRLTTRQLMVAAVEADRAQRSTATPVEEQAE